MRPNFGEHRNFWIGVTGAAVAFALLAGSLIYAKAGIGDQSVTAEFEQAAGLRTGATVRVAGVEVGEVRGLTINGDHIDADLNVHSSIALGADTRAAIKVATLLGSQYVELVPGHGGALPNDTIDRAHTTVPYSLSDVINVGTPKFQGLDTKRLAESLNVLNQQFGQSAPLAAQALDSVGALTKVLNDRKGDLQTLLQSLAKVATVLSDNRTQLMVAINDGDAIATKVLQRQALVTELMNNIAALSRQLAQLGATNDGKLGPMITQLNTISQGLEKNKENLDRMLQVMPVAVRQFANVTGNGNYAELYIASLFPDNWLCFAKVVPECK